MAKLSCDAKSTAVSDCSYDVYKKERKLKLRNMMGAPSHYKIYAYRKLTTPKTELNALDKTSDNV